MGVTVFRVDAGEHVTSLFPVLEPDAPDEPAGPDGEGGGAEGGTEGGPEGGK
jgi:hypothetical protein